MWLQSAFSTICWPNQSDPSELNWNHWAPKTEVLDLALGNVLKGCKDHWGSYTSVVTVSARHTLFYTSDESLVKHLKAQKHGCSIYEHVYRHVSTCIQLYTYLVRPPESCLTPYTDELRYKCTKPNLTLNSTSPESSSQTLAISLPKCQLMLSL